MSEFARPLSPSPGNAEALTGWIVRARDADLPFLHSFATGLERDRAASDAALTLRHHNGHTGGVNKQDQLLKRQTDGRAGYRLLRHRILLN
ncbi:transposase [Streptomyces olivoreticuli]|uniref:transposase n=1 Tax=Streptomyces olivoreticuli TaxID=68246 RepID=UPI0013C29FD1|nr:transposase [Streptomyces olivoreticuli]